MSAFAADFEPMARIAEAGGPTKTIPAPSHAAANPSFSERNPYPGWIACAPVAFAASRMRAPTR